jgi:SAM-dependent methyltransferase
MNSAGDRTISDFGEQFSHYHDNEGYFGSAAFLANMLGPLLSIDQIEGRRVAEIGSGAGRIVGMLLEAGAAHVTALEPSDAFNVLTRLFGGRQEVTFIRQPGDKLPQTGDNDFVFCMGVMQFIPDTAPVVRAARGSLKPGGRFIVRVYAYEGNQIYLSLVIHPLRLVTPKLPHFALAGLVRALDLCLVGYMQACKVAPLPMRDYFLDVVAKLSTPSRRLTIYDQLNPSYVRYYTRQEAETLLAGEFEDIRLYHHRETTWTIIGTKPVR